MGSLALNTVNSYKRGAFSFPSDDIDPKKKDAEWGRKYCEAMYASWVNDRTAIPYSRLQELHTLRRYGAGDQDIKKYQKILASEDDQGQLSGFMNINWEICSVMPKFKHIIRGMFEAQEHATVATAVDPKSVETKELAKLRKWFKSRYRNQINQVRQMNDVGPMEEWLPESADELELYQTMGGLKLAKEIEIEEGLNYTFYISDWAETKRKLIDDFVDLNCAGARDYTDQYTKRVKCRYVNPTKLIIQYSRHWDHRNSEYAGEIITESLSNIRKNTELTEENLRNLAEFYNGRNGNPNLPAWDEDSLKTGSGYRYDNFQIDILDAEWKAVNSKYKTTRTNERGETFTYDDNWGVEVDKPKRKTKIHRYHVIYRGKWIIGSEYMYDFGLQYDIPRPGKKEVELSFKFYMMPGRSITSLAMPSLDQMQLTALKMQNAIAMSAPSGIAVEYSSLQNMKLGGTKAFPQDILALRRDTGDVFFKLTTHSGRVNVPGGFRPIQELTGGIGPQLEEFVRIFDFHLNIIREFTGINQIADASTPDPNQSVGGSQLAVAATTNALRPIYSGYIRIKELVGRASALRLQIQLRKGNEAYKQYIPVVGEAGVKILAFDQENMDADYHIKIQAKPTEQRKGVILQAAAEAMKPDREGHIGIEYQDFLMIERLLDDGNLKYAEYFLAYRSQKNKQRQIQLQRENMAIDAENAQETARVKEEEERRTMQAKTDEKIRETQGINEAEEPFKIREHERNKELELLKLGMRQQQQKDTAPIKP